MAQTETFDPKRYTPFQPGVNIKDVLSTFPTIDTAVDNIKFTQGLEQVAQRHRPRNGHSHVQRRRSRLHPALAAPVPLAHRLRPAAADGDAAHRRRRLANARPEEPGRARPSSPSARPSRAPARSARSRRFTPPVSSAPSTARSSSSIRRTRRRRCGRRRNWAPERFRTRRQLFEKLLAQEPVGVDTAATSSASRWCARSKPPTAC